MERRVEWNGMEWNRVESSGMEWSRMIIDGMNGVSRWMSGRVEYEESRVE